MNKQAIALLVAPLLLCIDVYAETSDQPKIIQEQQGKVTNLRIEGSLAPTQDIACIAVAEVKATYTPPDLHTGITKCIQQGDFDKAAKLFALSGLYARFDAERIMDRTAQGGGQVLIARTFEKFPQEQRNQFASAFKSLQASAELQTLCTDITRIGPPEYFPKYLILHGMKALTSPDPLKDALKPEFDAASTWTRLRDTYLHCPK